MDKNQTWELQNVIQEKEVHKEIGNQFIREMVQEKIGKENRFVDEVVQEMEEMPLLFPPSKTQEG